MKHPIESFLFAAAVVAAQFASAAVPYEGQTVPYLIRYAFDVPHDPFSPFAGISFDGAGRTVLTLRELNEEANDVTLFVLSTTDLTDWSEAEVRELTIESDGTLVFDHASDPARFYKLTAEN